MSDEDRKAAMKAEHQRQANAYTQAISTALMEATKQFAMPIMNSAAGGCVGVLGTMLAAIPESRDRKALYDAILKSLRKEYRDAAAKAATGVHGAAQTVVMGKFQ